MKNTVKGLIFLLLLLVGTCYANAATGLVNNNNIRISSTEYKNLINLGFTKDEIQNMTQTEFNNNKNLKGKIVSQKVIDLPIEDDGISTKSYIPGSVETVGKKMTTTIISVNNRYRYKVTLKWKTMPSTRSYDIIGIGIDPTVKIASGLYFKSSYCYSKTNCDSNGVNTQKVTSTGASSIYKLPSASVVSMNSYLYFDVEKNTSDIITQLNAYGDYAHATNNVSLNTARNHTINRGGIKPDSSIADYYDSMPSAIATMTCNW